jgi:hypothetical protein
MTNIQITAQNLVDELRLAFPEIEDRYQNERNSWGNEPPGNYNIFGFVFKPLLREELAKCESEEFMRRLCSFMERVCASSDVEAINVIWLKIFKLLLHAPETVKLLWPLLGPNTRLNIEDAAARWGMICNLPVLARVRAARFLITPHREG